MHIRKLSVLASLAWIITGCVSEPVYELEETFSLPHSKTATVNSADPIRVTFDNVEDSRCPSDVVCVTAGSVTTDITLQYAGEEQAVQLALGTQQTSPTTAIGDDNQYTVELLSVSPYPETSTPTDTSQYSAELVVHFDPTVCSALYAPQCGLQQVTCITTPCQPVYKTFSNSCRLETENADFAFDGECGDIEGQAVPIKSEEPMACIEIYAPVCGIVGTEISRYSNGCYAEVAGALVIPDHHCDN